MWLSSTGLITSFEQPMYMVNEDGGSIEVCVLLSTASSETVTIELSASDGSALAGLCFFSSTCTFTTTGTDQLVLQGLTMMLTVFLRS